MHLKDPHVGTFKGGRTRMSRGGRTGARAGTMPADTFGVPCSSSKRGSEGEVRLQPSHYGLESKRGRSSSPLAKGISLPHCPFSQPGRGGWEPLNYTMMETAIAGRGSRAMRYELCPLPHTLR